MAKKADDLSAVREIATTLQPFENPDRERILRWVRERLGMGVPPASATPPTAPPSGGPAPAGPPGIAADIKTFIETKNPKSDRQLAAAVAYYYRFVAPEAERKDHITASDLLDACRKVGRKRPTNAGQTLRNALSSGYLDKAGGTGNYKINSVGENLVAVVLPSGESSPRLTRRKQTPRRPSGKRKRRMGRTTPRSARAT